MIDKELLRQYNKTRDSLAQNKICHAPFSSINFEQNGNMTACCFNRVNILGKYPSTSIFEAWSSDEAEKLRNKIDNDDLSGGCKLCGIFINQGNFQGTKAIYYDEFAQTSRTSVLKKLLGIAPRHFPKVFEFEISNTCNLACNMCSGYYSSTIRKKREKLPEIYQPYDDEFVSQVAEFLPVLTDLKFLGGEPFLIDIYYKIWEKVIDINPEVKIHITSNGTVFNNRVKSILSKLRVGFVLSIDAMDKEVFESIRIGAKFETVMTNFEHFRELAKEKKTYLSIAACAMNNNWKEFPKLVEFANEKQVSLHFNVVWNPGHLSMRFMDYNQLEEIERYLLSFNFKPTNSIEKNNLKAFEDLIQTIVMWKDDRAFTKLNNLDSFENVGIKDASVLADLLMLDSISGELAQLLLNQYFNSKDQIEVRLPDFTLINKYDNNIKLALFAIWRECGDNKFTSCFFELLPLFGKLFYGEESYGSISIKSTGVMKYVQGMKEQQAVIGDLIDDIDKKSIVNQLQLIHGNELTSILDHIKSSY